VKPRVILASASPRRRELMTLIGIPHEVRPADIDESYLPGEVPRDHALRLAREKAQRISDSEAVVVGSDTIVVVDGEVLGKPRDEREAARMLERLSGRTHTVITAVAVSWRGHVVADAESVEVRFHQLSDQHISDYIATGEPMDKAGAYGIQGFGATIVAGVDGDYFAVMGLPLQRMVMLMRDLGLRYRFGALEA